MRAHRCYPDESRSMASKFDVLIIRSDHSVLELWIAKLVYKIETPSASLKVNYLVTLFVKITLKVEYASAYM